VKHVQLINSSAMLMAICMLGGAQRPLAVLISGAAVRDRLDQMGDG
jgi:hypothetical protein